MADVLMKAEINCETGEVIERPYTAEELANFEAFQQQQEERIAAENAEKERIAALKESAKAKLIAGEPLTEEEASVLVI